MQLKVTERFGNDNVFFILLQLIAPDAKYESIVHLHAETTHPPHKHRKKRKTNKQMNEFRSQNIF